MSSRNAEVQLWLFKGMSHLKAATLTLLLVFFLLYVLPGTASEELPCPGAFNETIKPSNMAPLNVTITFITKVRNKGGGKKYAGAFFIAVDELNEMAKNASIPVKFTHKFYDIEEKEVTIVRKMVEVSNLLNRTAFVGPPHFCETASLLATALEIPYISFQCGDAYNKTGLYTMINTDPSIAHASTYIVEVLAHFKWKSFWLVSGTETKWNYAAMELKSEAENRSIRINGHNSTHHNDRHAEYDLQNPPYTQLVMETKEKTRVYVFLGAFEPLITFLRELYDQGVTQAGKHVVVAVHDSTGKPLKEPFYLTDMEKKPTPIKFSIKFCNASHNHSERVKAFGNTLLVRPHVNFNMTKEFEDVVAERNTQPPINLTTYSVPAKYLKKLMTDNLRAAVTTTAYHLYDATMIYGMTVMDLMAKKGADPLNATHVICAIREKKKYDSKTGYPIEILNNGESRSTFIVQAVTFKDGCGQRELKAVGDFRDNKFFLSEGVDWVDGQPKSEPDCGFKNENCPPIVGVLVALILIAIVAIIAGCRYYMYEKKLDSLAWKININDIDRMNDSQFKAMMTPSRSRKKESIQISNQLTELLSSADGDVDFQPEAATGMEDSIEMGMYKGSRVVIKQLARKQLELTRPLKKQLQVRKEMSHENINRFIGVCLDTPQVLLVSLYCPRKSLKDILEDEDSNIDEMFRSSLVADLIRGMTYIHDSDLGCHGNLKSSNCLVDGRWTLKLSDFGFSTLGAPARSISHDEKTFKKLLWTAPELLYRRFNSSTSSNSNSQHHSHNSSHYSKVSNGGVSSLHVTAHHHGTQKGDIYSFGILLYEIYGRSGPWGPTELSSKEIIDKLLVSSMNPFRPDMSLLTCDENVKTLIESCWAEDIDSRPDFKHTISLKFKPIEQKYLESNIIDNMLAKMEKYANNLEAVVTERTDELRKEKRMTEKLLLRMLPRSVAEILMKGLPVKPEQFECVTIYFSDIVGFTELSAECTPMEVVDFLNALYTLFDSIIELFDVYKVETIGDAYMVVSGLPKLNGDRHAGEIASMSLLLLEAIQRKLFKVRKATESIVKIRIGIHSGPCCSGVVGLKMPRYCLFGDTVNTANRMESTGEPFRIHCSSECKQILDKLGGYQLVERGYTSIKGKGQMLTFFLVSENGEHRQTRLAQYNKGNRCVSTSNLDYNSSFNLNRRGIPRPLQGQPPGLTSSSISLPQQSQLQSQRFRNSWVEKTTDPSSPNTSMDSTWSEIPEDPMPLHTPENRSSSLLRSSSLRHSSTANMSPIAEDPWSTVEPQEWTQRLSRTSQPVSDRDSLLSCHAMTSSGVFPGRRGSDTKPANNSVGGSVEERTKLMDPETVL